MVYLQGDTEKILIVDDSLFRRTAAQREDMSLGPGAGKVSLSHRASPASFRSASLKPIVL